MLERCTYYSPNGTHYSYQITTENTTCITVLQSILNYHWCQYSPIIGHQFVFDCTIENTIISYATTIWKDREPERTFSSTMRIWHVVSINTVTLPTPLFTRTTPFSVLQAAYYATNCVYSVISNILTFQGILAGFLYCQTVAVLMTAHQ